MTGPESFQVRLFWWAAIGASIFVALCSTVFSLTHGIYEVFPFLYFLPILLFVYRDPLRGVVFTLVLSSFYLILVYSITNFSPMLVAVSTAWFVIFITIGMVTSSFAERMRAEERKYRGIFENSQAGIFTFDLTTRKILDLNGKCVHMLKYEPGEIVGRDLERILPPSDERELFLQEIRSNIHTGDHELLLVTSDDSVRQFLVSASLTPDEIVICSLIDITERKLAEKVIKNARDDLENRVNERTVELHRANDILKAEIRERKRFAAAIQLSNRKLNTLSSITRHDILNQVTAIVMYISIAEEINKDPQVHEHLRKIEEITQLILRQIRFTRDYQNIGSTAPSWQEVSVIVNRAKNDISPTGIRIELDVDEIEIYTDLLVGKVFMNLIDNTVRHGEHATLIRISYQYENEDLVLVYEDNGVGIPDAVKKKIFKREFYRNTGYGLFLSQEILSISGATIHETGIPGTGARFEIHVPKGMFRLPDY
ncbi:MAG: PAS domain-containing sensor histidine kinase [Methanoregula sp.]|jgi:PAS domain S-box-containing protein|nr:PAS domain-containing sensor histidine kinase [Methanoregula sp.]